jgi:pimeloyl-ACP methyl ester carboxylesterase
VPGLSQDERSFEYLGSRLGSARRQVVAISPRGRGESETTVAGSYGWPAHARDVAEIATLLGQPTFDVMGWSFGAFISLQVAATAPGRLRRAVFLDALGRPEPSSLGPIIAGLERLNAVFGSVEEYTGRVLSAGVVDGCGDAWESYLSQDLVRGPDGFRTRTNSDAVVEDARYGAGQDPTALWPALIMPVLLVRAAQPILPGLGFVVSAADRDRFRAEVQLGQVVEVDANHYCLGYVEETARAVERFLDE